MCSKTRKFSVGECSYQCHTFILPGPLLANLNLAAVILHKHRVLPLIMSFMLHQLKVFRYLCFIWRWCHKMIETFCEHTSIDMGLLDEFGEQTN